MQVTVRLFAGLHQAFAAAETTIEVVEGATALELIETLTKELPEAEELLLRSAVAINGKYALAAEKIALGDDVAIIPPVSGG